MKIVLSIEKDGEKTEASLSSFDVKEEDIDVLTVQFFTSISEYRIARRKHYDSMMKEAEKAIDAIDTTSILELAQQSK